MLDNLFGPGRRPRDRTVAGRFPAELVREIAGTIDPRDDAAIRSAAEQLAGFFQLPLDVVERAIRAALQR